MKAGVVVFPGTNCDRDTKMACDYLGWETEYIWHDETNLDKYDIVFLPGGFSYGDYIRAGRLAKFSPAVMALNEYVDNKRGYVVGICNGFQILCERELLPGILSVNDNTRFICEEVELETNIELLPKKIKLPIAHAEGRYIAPPDVLEEIENNNMAFLRYSNNPNGSANNIAGLFDRTKNVIGLMPHPERAMFTETANQDGLYFFEMIKSFITN